MSKTPRQKNQTRTLLAAGCIVLLTVVLLACTSTGTNSGYAYSDSNATASPSPTPTYRTPRPTYEGEAEATVQSAEVNTYLTKIAADQAAQEAQQAAAIAEENARIAAAQVTAQAAATYEALKIEGTRRAMDAEATQVARDLQSTDTAQTATSQAAAAATQYANNMATGTAVSGATATQNASNMATGTAVAGATATRNAQSTEVVVYATQQGIADATATAEAYAAHQRELQQEREELWLNIAKVLLPVGQGLLIVVLIVAVIICIGLLVRSVPAWNRAFQLRMRSFKRDKAGRSRVFVPEQDIIDQDTGQRRRTSVFFDPSIAGQSLTVVGEDGVAQPSTLPPQLQALALLMNGLSSLYNTGRWPYPQRAESNSRPRQPNLWQLMTQAMGQAGAGGMLGYAPPLALPSAPPTHIVDADQDEEVGGWVTEVEGQLIEEG